MNQKSFRKRVRANIDPTMYLQQYGERVRGLAYTLIHDMNRVATHEFALGTQILCWMYVAGAMPRAEFMALITKEIMSDHVVGENLAIFQLVNDLDDLRDELRGKETNVSK